MNVATPEGDQPREIEYFENTAEMSVVLIPAGEFMMGAEESPEEVARKCDTPFLVARWFEGEHPRHRVCITRPFYMGAHEVTRLQYAQVMGLNGAGREEGSKPAESVSWYEAGEFCARLSQREGLSYRLPTEAEWEYACRAGSTTPFHFRHTITTDRANYDGRSTYGDGPKGEFRWGTMPVGSFPPNAFGLYDMHGNVSEWCQDRYGECYYANSPIEDPVGDGAGGDRVVRGGSWGSKAVALRSAHRSGYDPTQGYTGVGIRVVAVVE